MASIMTEASLVLDRNPSIPIFRSVSREAREESLDRTRSATSGISALILRASSMPSIPGMTISSIITSGFNSSAFFRASKPLPAVPTISIPFPSSMDDMPISIRGWSSTSIILTLSAILRSSDNWNMYCKDTALALCALYADTPSDGCYKVLAHGKPHSMTWFARCSRPAERGLGTVD